MTDFRLDGSEARPPLPRQLQMARPGFPPRLACPPRPARRRADWPRLATAILDLPIPLRARADTDAVLDLTADCAAHDFRLGLIALQVMANAWRARGDAAAERFGRIWAAVERELVALSLRSGKPADAARKMPRRDWARRAAVIAEDRAVHAVAKERGRAE